MSDDDLGGLIVLPVAIVLASYVLVQFYAALPWWILNSHQQSVAANVENTTLSVLSVDPTVLLVVIGAIISALVGLALLLGRDQSGSDSI